MLNESKLIHAFTTTLEIEPKDVVDELSYNSIKQWDSVAHMQLVAALEDAFGVMLDTDEIIELSSVAKAKDILTRHDIAFSAT